MTMMAFINASFGQNPKEVTYTSVVHKIPGWKGWVDNGESSTNELSSLSLANLVQMIS